MGRMAGLMLVGCCLLGQAPSNSVAQRLASNLRRNRGGLLLVMDGPKGEWKAKLNALAATPDWIDLELPLAYYGSKGNGLEPYLTQTYSVGPAPQWLLFKDSALVASGAQLPDAAGMAQSVVAAGIRSEIQVLREFLRQNPEHLAARGALLNQLKYLAGRKTLVRLGQKVDPILRGEETEDYIALRKKREEEEEAKARQPKEDKPLPMLGDQEDQAIWGEAADLCRRSFLGGDWLEMDIWTLNVPEAAKQSPLMQAMGRAALPEVERVLAHNPNSFNVWFCWLNLAQMLGGRPIRPLLDQLVPLPTTAPGDWPPIAVQDAYVKDARERKDWTSIREFLLPKVESQREWESAGVSMTWVHVVNGKAEAQPETGDYWRATLEPLVEALIWLGESNLADELVRERYAKHPWPALPQRASALAAKCGQTGLAARWAALGSGR